MIVMIRTAFQYVGSPSSFDTPAMNPPLLSKARSAEGFQPAALAASVILASTLFVAKSLIGIVASPICTVSASPPFASTGVYAMPRFDRCCFARSQSEKNLPGQVKRWNRQVSGLVLTISLPAFFSWKALRLGLTTCVKAENSGKYVTIASRQPSMMMGFLPILSDIQPNTRKNGVPMISVMAMMR